METSIFLTSLEFLGSMLALLFGANIALESAERIGKKLGLPPLVIGIVFIGFGTSLPELFVSQIACLRGFPAMSVGNIIGSNIANTGLILGICALIVKLPISDQESRTQAIFNLSVTTLFILIYFFLGKMSYLASFILLIFFVFYMFFVLKTVDSEKSDAGENISYLKNIGLFIFGSFLLYVGGDYLVKSTTKLGHFFNVSDYIISAIVLGLGTSAPELFTALITCFKKKNLSLIYGNIIGSNIFNMGLILGTTGFYSYDLKIIDLNFELGILLIISIYLLFLSFFRPVLKKKEGVIMLGLYLVCVHQWLNR